MATLEQPAAVEGAVAGVATVRANETSRPAPSACSQCSRVPYFDMNSRELMPRLNCTLFFGIAYLPGQSSDASMHALLAHPLRLIGNKKAFGPFQSRTLTRLPDNHCWTDGIHLRCEATRRRYRRKCDDILDVMSGNSNFTQVVRKLLD